MHDDLDRFVRAQAQAHGGWSTAIGELSRGAKTSHWIWWILPQLRGLGTSATAVRYGLEDLDEARAYLGHPVLGPRLAEAISVIRSRLSAGVPLATLMGSGIDCAKLVSSLTLFAGIADGDPAHAGLVADARAVLALAAAQGYSGCRFTERALER